MRIAVLANILGNLYALNAVLEDLKQTDVDRFIILGNSVGYGPHDQQVLKTIQKLNIIYHLKGNQENSLFSDEALNKLNIHLAQTIIHARKNIGAEYLTLLEHCQKDCIHAKRYYFLPEVEIYPGRVLNQTDSIRILIMKFSQYHIISSFSHLSFLATLNNKQELEFHFKSPCTLPEESTSFLSVGSVGYPGGGVATARYAILDTDEGKLWFRESTYDYTKTQRDMLIAGISKTLISQLSPFYNKSFGEP